MDDKLKWVLLAVGGYFLYDWYTKQAAAPATPSAPATPAGAGAGTGTAPSASAVVVAPDNVPIATRAAAGDAAAIATAIQRGLRFNYHQWNWFRSQTFGAQPDPAAFATDPAAVVDVTTYLAALGVGIASAATVVTGPAEAAFLQSMPVADLLTNAAGGSETAMAEVERRGLRFNYHQWNYYWAQVHGAQPDPTGFASVSADTPVSLAQYLADRSAHGLSGLGRWGGPILPWSTAWSA